jgi:endonuclease/exonuclease/phosphatase family metal-dependent hydrolase
MSLKTPTNAHSCSRLHPVSILKIRKLKALLFILTSMLAPLCAANPTDQPAKPNDVLQVLSWNILHGGRDDGVDVGPQRVIDVIRESGADVIAMQETYGSGEIIAQSLGFEFHPRGTNVSILSRYPVIEDLSVFKEFECVGALISLPNGKNVAVFSIWLPYDQEIWEAGTRDTDNKNAMLDACRSSAIDLEQIRVEIAQRLADTKYDDVPIIIAGDFNSMSHLDYTEIARDQFHVVIDWPTSHTLIDQGWRDAYRETHPSINRTEDRTWTPRFPVQEQDRIDFVYYKGNSIRAVETQVIDDHPVKFPSDHAALLAVFEPRPPLPDTTTIQAMTYNIRHGQGTDNRIDLNRIAAVLNAKNPDFVALQEVDLRATRSNGINQASTIAELLNMHAAFGGFMPFQGGHYGMAVLSRYPITQVRPIRLPDGNEPRVALAVDARLPNGQTVIVISVHFDWVDDDNYRYSQAETLANWIDQQTNPCILMGDFNDTPGSRTLQLFTDRAIESKKPADDRFTFSSVNPQTEIDFIFCIPPNRWSTSQAQITHEPLASDHNPVNAKLQLLSPSTSPKE